MPEDPKPSHMDKVEALSDRDQTTADTDQTTSDLDQGLAESDQASSERDQRASDRDQQSAERDRAASAKAQRTAKGIDPADFERSTQDRALSTGDRERSSGARSQTTSLRDANATRRDEAADERDRAAHARDRLAATIDAEMELLEHERAAGNAVREPEDVDLVQRAAEDRRRAAGTRERAAEHRDAAARDRRRAAEDREQAAGDRRAAAEALTREGIDHLTGALTRRTGLGAIRRELARTARSGELLMLVFVDVDGLKITNDTLGHPAGDAVLRAVAGCITEDLRSYDVVMRFGGDEFVCALTGPDAAGAKERFGQIADRIAATANDQTVSIGIAERQPHESLETLIARADGLMLDERRRERA
jgi:diguanylate cyclase (GGDEF)-like protein